MNPRVITIVLLVTIFFTVLTLGSGAGAIRWPDNQRGYEPIQPIEFSHRLHAGELELDCMFCHSGAESSRHAGIPATDTCMKCHRFITASSEAVRAENRAAQEEGRPTNEIISLELRKLYDAMGLDETRKPISGQEPRSLEWVRIHDLPDFVFFHHGVHGTAGVSCRTCHGPVESMERIRQVEDLSMGWCIDCHRKQTGSLVGDRRLHPSLDCAACHY